MPRLDNSGLAEDFAEAEQRLRAPGVPNVPSDKGRAVITARNLLRAPNVNSSSDLANLAAQFLRVLGLN